MGSGERLSSDKTFVTFQPSGFFMLTRGIMSVLSSLFFFCLGSGAVETQPSAIRKPTSGRHVKLLTFLVLLNIEATKQHNGLSSVDAAIDLVGRFNVGTVLLIQYFEEALRVGGLVNTHSSQMRMTPPQPPKRSLRQPK